jgi:hypothetical protein
MAIRKTNKGSDLKRWFAEKWTDQKGRPCGNNKTKGVKKCRPSKKISGETPATWKEVGSRKSSVVAEKKRVGMGNRAKPIRRKSNAKSRK